MTLIVGRSPSVNIWIILNNFNDGSVSFPDKIMESRFSFHDRQQTLGASLVTLDTARTCSLIYCARVCRETSGCMAINHRTQGGCQCALVSSSAGLDVEPVSDADWTLLVVNVQ